MNNNDPNEYDNKNDEYIARYNPNEDYWKWINHHNQKDLMRDKGK